MRRLIVFVLAAVCSVCAAQAQPVIFGTAEDMEAVKKYKADKRGYEACIKKKVDSLRPQAEALSKKITSAEGEINRMYKNSVNTPLDTNKLSQKQQNLDGLKKQKEELDGKIEANTQACQTQFPAREWHGIVDVAAMERQRNFNQSVLELLRKGDFSQLDAFLRSFPRAESFSKGDTPPEGTVLIGDLLSCPNLTVALERYDGFRTYGGRSFRSYKTVTYPVVSAEVALRYGLTMYYKELYGADIKVKNAAHYRDFMNRFSNADEEIRYTAKSLLIWHATGMKDESGTHYAIGSAMRNDNYEKAGRYVMRLSYGMDTVKKGDRFPAGLITYEIKQILGDNILRDTPEYYGQEFSKKLKRILDGAYGESVKLNAKGIFHQLKRDLLHERLESGYEGNVVLANGGFELLAIQPITPEDIKRVTQMVEQCRQKKLPHRRPRFDKEEDRWNRLIIGPFKEAASKYGYYQDVSTTVQRGVRQNMQNRKSAVKK